MISDQIQHADLKEMLSEVDAAEAEAARTT
jgi:hypothetical protein